MLFLTTCDCKICKGGPGWSGSALVHGRAVTAEVPAELWRGKQDKDVRPQLVKGSWCCELWLTVVSWLQTSVGLEGGAWQRIWWAQRAAPGALSNGRRGGSMLNWVSWGLCLQISIGWLLFGGWLAPLGGH